MVKTIYWVYQDCPMCGQKKNWAEKQLHIAGKHNFEIVKTSFATEKGRHLIRLAFEMKKLESLPFFTDGKKFSRNIEDFIPRQPKRKTRKVKRQDGDTK